MPWQEVCPMDEKLRFIGALLAQEENMTEVCERFGISRKTGYKLRRRYQAEGVAGLVERSRAPQVVPWAISQAQAEATPRASELGAEKAARPAAATGTGAGMAGAEHDWRAAARQGLSQPRKRRRRSTPGPSRLRTAVAANEVWSIDFKGWFRTGDGARCDPLTVSDAYSRYLLCAQSVARPDYANCRSELERVFKEYGLPCAIRSDNGTPFASLGVGAVSRLSVWWIKLGIIPERIEPGKPQQNGRHERMHRTLKAECARPPAQSLAAQQRRFDQFRTEFNQQRPHQALGQTPPAQHYACSPRNYPKRLADPCYPADYELRRVRCNGVIKWQGELVFIGAALIGEVVGLRENQQGDSELFFGPVPLGVIDAVTLKLVKVLPMLPV
jgi:putative transposase